MTTDNKNYFFDWIQLGILLLIAPLLIFPRGRFAWVLFIIPALMLVRKAVKGRFVEQTLLDIPLLILLVQLLLSSLLVADPIHVFPKAAGLLLAVAIFYAVVALLKTGKLLYIGVFLFLAGGSAFALLGLSGMYTFKVKHLTLLMKIKEALPQINFKLPGAEMGFSPNAVGGILLLVVPLFAAMVYVFLPRWFKPRQWKHLPREVGNFTAVFLMMGLLVTSGVLLLTQSRGSWLGLLLATGILVVIALRKRKRLLFAMLGVLLVITAVFIPSMMKVDQVQLTTKQAEGTLLFRVQMWDEALPRIYEHPLLGLGLNEFRYLPEIKYGVSHAHNRFFHTAVELGLPAAAAWMALLILIGYMLVKAWQNTEDPGLKLIILGLGWGQLAFAIYEMTDVIPFGSKVGIFQWLSLALITAIYHFTVTHHERTG